jgi:hypothetical protein
MTPAFVFQRETMLYRLAALPVPWIDAREVIVTDQADTLYLLAEDFLTLTELSPEEARAITGFYEPTCSSRWHTLEGLRAGIRPTSLREADPICRARQSRHHLTTPR